MKYLIFDFNGTIVDDLPLVVEIMTESLKTKEIDLSKYSIEYLRRKGVRKFMEEINISKIELLWIYKEVKQKIKARQSSCPIVKDLKKYLSELSSKYKLLIFSNNSPEVIKDYLVKNSIDKYFSGVYEDNSYFGKDVGLTKILKELKIDKNDVTYFGDESRDIVAAKKAGIKSVAVTWGFEGEIPLSTANPDFLINKPEELLNIDY
ncbi:MAG: HAD-IA family hydrolase [Microgenomates group bacterium]